MSTHTRLKIDLKTRTLPADPEVFMVRPGASYHLRKAVRQFNAIAVDVPGLEVKDGSPVDEIDGAKNPDFVAMLERARVLRSWAAESQKKRGPQPTNNLDHYKTFLEERGPRASRTKLRNAANKVLWEIPDHSLIYIPSSTLSGKAILAEAGPRTAKRVRVYGSGSRKKLEYLARPIINPKMVPMRDLPSEVTDQSQKLIVHDQFSGYAETRLLRAYYGDYQQGTRASVVEFVAGADNFDSKVIAQLSALAMSLEHFTATGAFVHPREMVFGYPTIRGPELHARINSKDGTAQVESTTQIPHVLKAFLICSVCSIPTALVAAQLFAGGVSVCNSALEEGAAIVAATQNTLVDYSAAAGVQCLEEIVENLKSSVEATNGRVSGDAEF